MAIQAGLDTGIRTDLCTVLMIHTRTRVRVGRVYTKTLVQNGLGTGSLWSRVRKTGSNLAELEDDESVD